MKLSIAGRLATMFALVALLVFTLIGVGLFPVIHAQLDAQLRESLDDRMAVANIIVYHANTPEKWRNVRQRLNDMSPQGSETFYAITSADPNFHYRQPFIGRATDRWPGGYTRVRPADDGPDMLTRTIAIPPYGTRPAVQLEVAASYAPNLQTMHVIRAAFGVFSVLGSLTVLLLSYFVTRLGLMPLRRLSRDASAVSPNNRSQRLSTVALPHELSDLANSFNGALERLDSAYARLESFNADVAHELRTPVTILIGQTQVALTRKRSVNELCDTLQSNLEEFERMRCIINDMLFLARADQGELATGLMEVSLADEVARTLEFLDIPFDEARVSAVSRGDAMAKVNRSLFGRACANLLINAIQHCVPGDTVTVTITRQDEQVWIAVANPGEAIDPSKLDHLFDRFYRAEPSRTNSRENHGLGLAIVKAVAEMHRGKVSRESAGGVNVFAFSVDGSESVQA